MNEFRPAPTTAVETELVELREAGHTRVQATMLAIQQMTVEARLATTVVLVEGVSDQVAVEVVADRFGRQLREDGVFVVPTGGASNFTRLLTMFGPRGRDVRVVGLYDSPAENRIRRSLDRSGIGSPDDLGSVGFHACVTDLEDEMIRSLGARRVEEIIAAEGELPSLRRLQAMPFHRDRRVEHQLHRFIGSRAGRKYRYARAFACEIELDELPDPLAQLLASV